MKWAIVALMVLGVVAALSATMLTTAMSAKSEADAAVVIEQTEVEILVATRDLPAMSVVDAASVARMTVFSNEAPDDALSNSVQVIGQVLVMPVTKGEAFTAGKLAKAEDRVNLAAVLPEGLRAMTVVLRTDTGVEELLYPGSIVDVVASFRLPAAAGTPSGEIVSMTLLQALQVLAVGKESVVTGERDEDEKSGRGRVASTRRSVVTLLVDPEQAEVLQLATMHGTVSLALRNPLDTKHVAVNGLLLSDLSGKISRQLDAISRGRVSAKPMEMPVTSRKSENEETGEAIDVDPESTSPRWTMVVLRGRTKETKMFPLEKAVKPESEARPENEVEPESENEE